MRDQGGVLKQPKNDLELTGLGQYGESESCPSTSSGVSVKEALASRKKLYSDPSDIDQQLVKLTEDNAQLAPKEMPQELRELFKVTKRIKQLQTRGKRRKLIKTDLSKIKRVRLTSQKDEPLVVGELPKFHKKRSYEEISDSFNDEGVLFPEIKRLKSGTTSKGPNRLSCSHRKRFTEAKSESTTDEEMEKQIKKLKVGNFPPTGNSAKDSSSDVSSYQEVNRRKTHLAHHASGNTRSTVSRPCRPKLKRRGSLQKGSSTAQKDSSLLEEKNKDSFAIYRIGSTVQSDDDSQFEDISNTDSSETGCSSASGSESSDWKLLLRNKLKPLDINTELDNLKLTESSKPCSSNVSSESI